MNYKWKISKIENLTSNFIKDESIITQPIANIMSQRGLHSPEKSKSFFYPKFSKMHDPFMMLGMDRAVKRINRLIKNSGTLLLFGDYDVDGTSGTSAMYLFFKELGVDVHFYIPNRKFEGHGLSNSGIDFAVGIGAELIITCDCGITAIEQTKYANFKGIDIIITDHHKQSYLLPNAYAILNPNQNDCNYPFKGLSGSGVAFKFICGIAQNLQLSNESVIKYTDLITLGIAADLVPLLDENRVIVSYGIKLLEQGKNTGLKALIDVTGISQQEITIRKLNYAISPKINAAGRLGDASRAVKLMTSSNPVKAKISSENLEKENELRQRITIEITEKCLLEYQAYKNKNIEKAIIVTGRDWHHGVIGIVASRLKENYHKPTIIVSFNSAGIGRASCRSISGFDIHDALVKCEQFLDQYGGHSMAAGFTIKKDNYMDFYSAFQNYATNKITDEMLIPCINIDSILKISDINSRLLKFLKKLGPYGPGNPIPRFAGKSIKIKGLPKIIGKNNDTLKFTVSGEKSLIDAIGFRMEKKFEFLISDQPVHIVFEIGQNYFKGQNRIQLDVKDIKSGDFPIA